MKKTLFVLVAFAVLFALSGDVFAQGVQYSRNFEWDKQIIKKYRTGTSMDSTSYANSQIDTTIAYNCQSWGEAILLAEFYDTVDVALAYQVSWDGATFLAPVVITAGVTTGAEVSARYTATPAANTSITAWRLPPVCMAAPAFRLQFQYQASANGVTTAYVRAALIRKR
jgi:hypothetical protein